MMLFAPARCRFMVSLSFWSWLVEKGLLPDGSFIQPAPHILFTHGADGAAWLRERVAKLSKVRPPLWSA